MTDQEEARAFFEKINNIKSEEEAKELLESINDELSHSIFKFIFFRKHAFGEKLNLEVVRQSLLDHVDECMFLLKTELDS